MKKMLIATVAVAGLALIATFAPQPVVAEDDVSPEAIQALYEKKCGMCHGKDGVAKKMGTGSGNFNDAEWKKATSKDAIVKVTTEGEGKMPKYTGKLTAAQIDAIADYVLKL